jgi:hypothetical protein
MTPRVTDEAARKVLPARRGGCAVSTTSRARFLRCATRRTTKCIEAIRKLGNCSNRATYQWEDHEVGQIFGRLASELERAQKMFEPWTSPIAFTLGEPSERTQHECRFCGRQGASRRSNICHESACPSRATATNGVAVQSERARRDGAGRVGA